MLAPSVKKAILVPFVSLKATYSRCNSSFTSFIVLPGIYPTEKNHCLNPRGFLIALSFFLFIFAFTCLLVCKSLESRVCVWFLLVSFQHRHQSSCTWKKWIQPISVSISGVAHLMVRWFKNTSSLSFGSSMDMAVCFYFVKKKKINFATVQICHAILACVCILK